MVERRSLKLVVVGSIPRLRNFLCELGTVLAVEKKDKISLLGIPIVALEHITFELG